MRPLAYSRSSFGGPFRRSISWIEALLQPAPVLLPVDIVGLAQGK